MSHADPLQRDILSTLIYFDIFNFPLRLPEIYQFLPTNSVALADLQAACFSHPLVSQISRKGEYLFLGNKPESIVEERLRKELRARRFWKIARLMSRVVSMFPFVRAVFVSGELSKGVASKRSDIDFLIVTQHNRVWIVRTLCAVFKRVFLFNRRKFFCYNHIVSEERMTVSERNIYTAMEIVTLRAVSNPGLLHEYLEANSWTKEYFPNIGHPHSAITIPSGKRPVAERILNILFSSRILDALDQWLLRAWRNSWPLRYPALTAEKRLELFQCSTDVSTSYVMDFCGKIMGQYEDRLSFYDLGHRTSPEIAHLSVAAIQNPPR